METDKRRRSPHQQLAHSYRTVRCMFKHTIQFSAQRKK